MMSAAHFRQPDYCFLLFALASSRGMTERRSWTKQHRKRLLVATSLEPHRRPSISGQPPGIIRQASSIARASDKPDRPFRTSHLIIVLFHRTTSGSSLSSNNRWEALCRPPHHSCLTSLDKGTRARWEVSCWLPDVEIWASENIIISLCVVVAISVAKLCECVYHNIRRPPAVTLVDTFASALSSTQNP